MSAPHLPKKVPRTSRQYHLQSVPWMFIVIAISVLASFTAALLVVVYIAPEVSYEQIIYSLGAKRAEKVTPDIALVNETKQRILHIYDRTKRLAPSGWYRTDAYLGNAAMLSSDGWAVMGGVDNAVILAASWDGIDSQGIMHTVEKTFADPVSGLLYLKFSGAGFRIMPLAPDDSRDADTSFFALQKDVWYTIMMGQPVTTTVSQTYPVWQEKYRSSLSITTPARSMILDQSGALVGFVDTAGRLIDRWLVRAQLGAILQTGKGQYTSLPIEGYVVEGVVRDGQFKKMTGWYVAVAPTVSVSSSLRKGDIIVRINDMPVTAFGMAERMLTSPDALTVTVWRDGAELRLAEKKQLLKLPAAGLTKK